MGNKKFLIGAVVILSLLILTIGSLYIHSLVSGAKTRVTVLSVTPEKEKTPQWADFTFTLSEPVIDNSLLNEELPSGAIQFSPTVKGVARWIERDKIGYFLESSLAPSARYSVELSPLLKQSTLGVVITGERKYTFETDLFRIQERQLEFKYTKTHAKVVGKYKFNYPVNIADLRANLSVKLQEDADIQYTLQPQTGIASEVSIETEEIPRRIENQKLHVSVKKGFKCTGGLIGLKDENVRSMTLTGRDTLSVTYANVRDSSGRPKISLRFSSNIPIYTVEPFIQIKPEIDTQIIARYSSIEIHGDFKRRAKYKVTIQDGLTAPDGSVLKKPFTRQFTIPDVPPQVRFAGNGFFLTRNQNMNIALATINVNKVNVEIEKVFANNLIYVSRVGNWNTWAEDLGKPIHTDTLDIFFKIKRRSANTHQYRSILR